MKLDSPDRRTGDNIGYGRSAALTSPEQRRKVAGLSCLVCGRAPVDPCHVVPPRLGGCASPDCVVALCRIHRLLYEADLLVLARHLRPELERELRHALTHLGCAELEAGLTGGGWPIDREGLSARGAARSVP